MPKVKYQFDTQSLRIEKVQRTHRDRFKHLLSVSAAGMVFAAAIILVVSLFFDSPEEKMLKRENDNYALQIRIMHDRMDQMQQLLDDLSDRDDNIYRVIFEAEPIASSVRKGGYGGIDRYARLEGYHNSELIISTAKKLDDIASQLYVQSKSFDEVFELAKNKEKMVASIPAIQPVKLGDIKRISSYFGHRTDPFYKVRKFHPGIDFSAPSGTPIYATGDGRVELVKKSHRGYGNEIIINHGYNYKTIYAHMLKFAVRRGQYVKRGELIGYVGNTGKSTAPHLHYEIRKNGKAVNPIYYFFNDLSPEEFDEVLGLSANPTQSMD